MRHNRLTGRTSTDATTPTTSVIFGYERHAKVERTSCLDKDSTATPVATATGSAARHGLVVGDVNLVGRTCRLNNAGGTARNTETTALGIVGRIARYEAARHGEIYSLVVKTSKDSTAGLMGVIGSNGAPRHGQLATVCACNATTAEETVVVKVATCDASVGSVVSYAGRTTDGYG